MKKDKHRKKAFRTIKELRYRKERIQIEIYLMNQSMHEEFNDFSSNNVLCNFFNWGNIGKISKITLTIFYVKKIINWFKEYSKKKKKH